MEDVWEHFSQIFLTHAVLKEDVSSREIIIIEASGVELLRGHPRYDPMKVSFKGQLRFYRPAFSRRSFRGYVGDPTKDVSATVEPQIVQLKEFGRACDHGQGLLREYIFEGTLQEPFGWVDWTIAAEQFSLRMHCS